MGNLVSSCSMMVAPTMRSSKAARVVLPGGEIRQFREPVKAAELMLESPSSFLVSAKSLTIGRRFSPLSADEDLEFGDFYIMFPMKRVNSMVTPADMAMFLMAANSAAKRISAASGSNGRISPESAPAAAPPTSTADDSQGVENGRPRLNLEEAAGLTAATEMKYRLAACRSRKPMLDTIMEEPVLLR